MRIIVALALLFASLMGSSLMWSSPTAAKTIPPLDRLTAQNQDFVTTSGKKVRLWGVNLVEFYPDHATATAFAKNLADRGVNLVRWHKMLEHNLNLNWMNVQNGSAIFCLASYKYDQRFVPQGTSRPDPEGDDATAWDRFDFLNAELQRNGIYVMMSVEFQRHLTPNDQSILNTTAADNAAWRSAILAMHNWGNYLFDINTGEYDYSGTGAHGYYLNTVDKWKMLPLIDERAALLYEEFVDKLLNHVNPYTGVAYKKSTQIVTFEVLNEYSSLYVTMNRNRFDTAPATVSAVKYFDDELQDKWRAFLIAHGAAYVNLYSLGTAEQKRLSKIFLTELDRELMHRMRKKFDSLGATVNLSFSNIFRSEDDSKLDHDISSYSEDHIYHDPFVVEGWTWDNRRHSFESEGVDRNVLHDFIYDLAIRKAFADRPFIVGEINMFDFHTPPPAGSLAGPSEIDAMHRSMMMGAAAAYGSLHNWSGVAWFAATHGGQAEIDQTGWSSAEAQQLPGPDLAKTYAAYLGDFMKDGQRLDHMRTLGLMFRHRLVAPSSNPINLVVDAPYPVSGAYPPPLKYYPVEGWQSVSAIRKSYGVKPAGQDAAPFMTQTPTNPLVSDTRQIIKDVARQQLTLSAPQAEAFSGNSDGAAPAGLKVIKFAHNAPGQFSTVVAIATDGLDFPASRTFLVSRTNMSVSTLQPINGPTISMAGVRAPLPNEEWVVTFTRPRSAYPTPLEQPLSYSNGSLVFPADDRWTEAEISLYRRKGDDASGGNPSGR